MECIRHKPPQEIGAMGHPKLLLPVRRMIGFSDWGRTYQPNSVLKGRLKIAQDIVLGWLPRIPNNSFQR
jgi:hypothetical protein